MDPDQSASLLARSAEALERPLSRADKRLFIGGERSIRRTLVLRAVLVLLMYLAVVLIFWLDRDGLKDHHDGHVSFLDTVYFGMVTVTTVGYGDIVPVTPRARTIDALIVSPIRLLIWLIFIGTAYQLVLQRLVEDIRMRMVQARLSDHVIICGFGHSGRSAAEELVARGIEKRQILIVDLDQPRLEDAAERGYVGILGNAASEEVLRRALLPAARALFVCTDRDDTNVLIVLTARHMSSQIRIVARVEEAENEKLLRQSGANATVLPSRVGGILMADSLDSSAMATYVMDLITAGGRITLVERSARPEDIGHRPNEIPDAFVVRVMRDGKEVMAADPEARIREGDTLVSIRPDVKRM